MIILHALRLCVDLSVSVGFTVLCTLLENIRCIWPPLLWSVADTESLGWPEGVPAVRSRDKVNLLWLQSPFDWRAHPAA